MKSAAKPFGSSIVPFIYASLFIITVWQLVVTFTNAHVALLPPPLLTAETFFELIISGELFIHTGASLGRVVAAWLLSAIVAVPLGLAMGRFLRFERVMDPLIELFRPISPLPGSRLQSYGSASARPARFSSFLSQRFSRSC